MTEAELLSALLQEGALSGHLWTFLQLMLLAVVSLKLQQLALLVQQRLFARGAPFQPPIFQQPSESHAENQEYERLVADTPACTAYPQIASFSMRHDVREAAPQLHNFISLACGQG